jgi:hypothetical protein
MKLVWNWTVTFLALGVLAILAATAIIVGQERWYAHGVHVIIRYLDGRERYDWCNNSGGMIIYAKELTNAEALGEDIPTLNGSLSYYIPCYKKDLDVIIQQGPDGNFQVVTTRRVK